MDNLESFNYNLTKNEIYISPLFNVIGFRHLQEIKNQTTWEGRIVHLSLGMLELIPVIGFIFTICEVTYIRQMKAQQFSFDLAPKVIYIQPEKPKVIIHAPYIPFSPKINLPVKPQSVLENLSDNVKEHLQKMRYSAFSTENRILIGGIAIGLISFLGFKYIGMAHPCPSVYACKNSSADDFSACSSLYNKQLKDCISYQSFNVTCLGSVMLSFVSTAFILAKKAVDS